MDLAQHITVYFCLAALFIGGCSFTVPLNRSYSTHEGSRQNPYLITQNMLDNGYQLAVDDRSVLIRKSDGLTLRGKHLRLTGDTLYFRFDFRSRTLSASEVSSIITYDPKTLAISGIAALSAGSILGGHAMVKHGDDWDDLYAGSLLKVSGGVGFVIGMISIRRKEKDKRVYFRLE